MKHILIGHMNGQPYYYDHPNGNILSMSLGPKMEYSYSVTGDRWRLIRTGNTLFYFSGKDRLNFLMLSDEGDSESYLQYQIQFLQDILETKYGPNVFEETLPGNRLKPLVSLYNNAKRFFKKKQTFLLGVTERLDMKDEKLAIIANIVKGILTEFGIPQIQYVLLTTSTKVILNYAKPKRARLPVDEILLIMTFIQANFYPMSIIVFIYCIYFIIRGFLFYYFLDEDFVQRKFQAADYRNHDNVKSNFRYGKEFFDNSNKDSDEGFVSCDSGGDDQGTEVDISLSMDDMHLIDDEVTFTPIETPRKLVVKNELSMSVPSVGVWTSLENKKEKKESKMIEQIKESSKLRTSDPNVGIQLAPEKLDVYKKEKRQCNSTPLHCQAYLKSVGQVFDLHSYEIEENFHLSILTNGDDLTEEEKNQLWNIKKEIKLGLQGGFLQLMNILRNTHLESIKLNYIHQLPGLVHFMYVERNSDRLYAPKISSLVGQNYSAAGVPGFKAECKEYLRKKIWDLVFQSQESLLSGYHSMLITSGEFQYSYRLWFEDPETSIVLPIDKSLKQIIDDTYPRDTPRYIRPLSSAWYQDLTKKLFPSVKRVRCYELYTLYLSGLNAKTITSHNNTLISGLRSN